MWHALGHQLGMFGRLALFAIAVPIVFCTGIWGAMALYYRLPGGAFVRKSGSALWAVLVLVLLFLAIDQRSWPPLVAYAAIHAALLLWWRGIAPSNQRNWRDDVARLLTGTVQDPRVRLHHVRNFDWRSDRDYDIRWESREYDLDRLVGADVVVSYWGSRAIAHAMISFGFNDARHLVFSVEVRKSREQKYSSIGGFFKQFETILVAADENDIIRVRTNVRGEDDYLFPLRIDPPTLRALFLSYVHAANRLALRPAFYNTFTSNCTTLVYRMARQIDRRLPWDGRLLLTGYLPEYLRKIGAVDPGVSIQALRQRGRITDRARAIRPQQDFSRVIRQGLDGSTAGSG